MRALSDETILLRDAIKVVLDRATEPMDSESITEHPEVFSLGLARERVSRELKSMHQAKTKPWPLKRVPNTGGGRSKWEYFNPNVVKLAPKRQERAQDPTPTPVNGVNPPASPQFEFNPVAFASEAAAPSSNASVAVPTGVKAITLTVSGVTVRIELN